MRSREAGTKESDRMRRELRARWFVFGVSVAFLIVGLFGIRYTGDLRWAWTSVPGILCGLWVLRPFNDDDER